MEVDVKHGDMILVLKRIRIFHISDYLRFFILFFINLPRMIFFQFHKICMFHHVATVCEEKGLLCVYESVSPKYKNSGSIDEYLKDPNIKSILILRPNFEFEKYSVNVAVNAMIGRYYDYWGTMFFQLIKSLTFGYVWLSNRHKAFKKIYCSEGGAFATNQMSKGKYAKEWWSWSPMDCFESELYNVVQKINLKDGKIIWST